jgi:N-acetylglucosamine kinase-like BadF-type ATPase
MSKSLIKILDGAVKKFDTVLNTAEVGLTARELSLTGEALNDLSDLRSRLVKASIAIKGEDTDE